MNHADQHEQLRALFHKFIKQSLLFIFRKGQSSIVRQPDISWPPQRDNPFVFGRSDKVVLSKLKNNIFEMIVVCYNSTTRLAYSINPACHDKLNVTQDYNFTDRRSLSWDVFTDSNGFFLNRKRATSTPSISLSTQSESYTIAATLHPHTVNTDEINTLALATSEKVGHAS